MGFRSGLFPGQTSFAQKEGRLSRHQSCVLFGRVRRGSILHEDGLAWIWHESALEYRASFASSVDRTETLLFEDVLAIVVSIYGRLLRHHVQF